MSSRPNLYPALDAATEAALRASIERFGVLVPVVVDQRGELLDGHHRSRIAGDLGIDCEVISREVANDDERREIARTLNEDRRMLSREQRLPVITALREEGHSVRAIARALKAHHTTIVRDIESGVHSAPPERVTGLDGKQYPATRPRGETLSESIARPEWNARAARKTHSALAAIAGYCSGLEGTHRDRAIAGATPDDIASWERVASETCRVLSQFRRALKEATQ